MAKQILNSSEETHRTIRMKINDNFNELYSIINLKDYYTLTQIDSMMPIVMSRTNYNILIANNTTLAGRSYNIYEG